MNSGREHDDDDDDLMRQRLELCGPTSNLRIIGIQMVSVSEDLWKQPNMVCVFLRNTHTAELSAATELSEFFLQDSFHTLHGFNSFTSSGYKET